VLLNKVSHVPGGVNCRITRRRQRSDRSEILTPNTFTIKLGEKRQITIVKTEQQKRGNKCSGKYF
jgi:hypothetical protein